MLAPIWTGAHSRGRLRRVSTPRVAFVTGASRGIGRAIAERLAFRGAGVIVSARRADDCADVVGAIRGRGGRAWPVALDLAAPESIERAVEQARALARELGPIDWLVNNAGIAISAPFLSQGAPGRERGSDLYVQHMDVNFHGPRRMIEAFVPAMIERRYGRVVNVASSAGLQPYAYVAAYVASKHALVGYSLSAARELAKSGVTLNLVCPHFVDSPMTAESIARIVERTGRTSEAARAALAAQNPSGALVSPEEVAEVVDELLAGERNGAIAELVGRGADRNMEAVRWR